MVDGNPTNLRVVGAEDSRGFWIVQLVDDRSVDVYVHRRYGSWMIGGIDSNQVPRMEVRSRVAQMVQAHVLEVEAKREARRRARPEERLGRARVKLASSRPSSSGSRPSRDRSGGARVRVSLRPLSA